jgi:hypothetical protein
MIGSRPQTTHNSSIAGSLAPILRSVSRLNVSLHEDDDNEAELSEEYDGASEAVLSPTGSIEEDEGKKEYR